MLVLSRQRDESIVIEYTPERFIIISIVDIRGDKVRIGVEAPSEIPVHRREVYEAIQKENLQASQLEPKKTGGLEGLETKTVQAPPQQNPNQEFINYLNEGKYLDAARVYEEHELVLGPDKSHELIMGLVQKLQLYEKGR